LPNYEAFPKRSRLLGEKKGIWQKAASGSKKSKMNIRPAKMKYDATGA